MTKLRKISAEYAEKNHPAAKQAISAINGYLDRLLIHGTIEGELMSLGRDLDVAVPVDMFHAFHVAITSLTDVLYLIASPETHQLHPDTMRTVIALQQFFTRIKDNEQIAAYIAGDYACERADDTETMEYLANSYAKKFDGCKSDSVTVKK